MFFHKYRSSWSKPGGLLELLKLALPAGISQACFSIMMFTDRLLLTPLGKEAPAASMVAGFASFLLIVFFSGLLNYITPLTGQLLGAKKKKEITTLIHQGLLIALISFPVVVIAGDFLASAYFAWTGIHEPQKALAESYFSIINRSAIFTLVNIVLSSFFAGTGRTYAVMIVNTLGMLVNIPLSYYFINYGIFSYEKGVEGAALGSLLSTGFMSLLFVYLFLSPSNKKSYGTNLRLKWDKSLILKLFKFGTASGLEVSLFFFAFSTFLAMFHSYGINEALSATIVLNWEVVAFMPVWGISIGLMSLVGKYMGAGEIKSALRAIRSAAIGAFFLMTVACFIFLTQTENLISVFLPDNSLKTYHDIVPLSSVMLKLICIYCLANAANLVLSGALRAAGDTKAVMYISVFGQWLTLMAGFYAIKVAHWDPLISWTIFSCSLFLETFFFSYRFWQGAWKKIKVV